MHIILKIVVALVVVGGFYYLLYLGAKRMNKGIHKDFDGAGFTPEERARVFQDFF